MRRVRVRKIAVQAHVVVLDEHGLFVEERATEVIEVYESDLRDGWSFDLDGCVENLERRLNPAPESEEESTG